MLEYLDPRTLYQDSGNVKITAEDKACLRVLAEKVRQYAEDPIQKEKINLWKKHNALKGERPMVLVFPEGAWLEIFPWESMTCENLFLRSYEYAMRRLIYRYERLHDDFVIEPVIEVPRVYSISPFLDSMSSIIHFDMSTNKRSNNAEKILLNEDDAGSLLIPKITFDDEATKQNVNLVKEIIGDILEVREYGYYVPDTSLLCQLIEMRGAEQILYDVYDAPEFLHQVLTHMRDNTLKLLDEMEKHITRPNTGNDYIGSGGVGYTDELCGEILSYKNCWGFSDAQELAGVSVQMYEEFATLYHKPLLERFGLSCYACCEPLDGKFEMIKKHIKNLRRVSISPWTDRSLAAKALEDKYIYSWKSNPALVTAGYDEGMVRKLIEETYNITEGCKLEMILKDTVTIGGKPERFEKWIAEARRVADGGY